MKTITSQAFKRIIDGDPTRGIPANPGWAATLNKSVRITGFCDMAESGITLLSEHLHFTGRNEKGDCANFLNCKALKIAEGKFDGFVDFSESGIGKIGTLEITRSQQLWVSRGFQPLYGP